MIYLFAATILFILVLAFIYNKKLNTEDITFDKDLSPEIARLDDNIVITKQILGILENDHTKVKQNKDENAKISFYNHDTDTIIMKNNMNDMKDFTRVVHIAHECIHTTQDKKFLIINKLFSNIQILYFLFLIIYLFYNKDEKIGLILVTVQILLWFATFFIKVVIESDASYRAANLANKYLEDKIDKSLLEKFNKKVEENIYTVVPKYYFSLFMQGGIMILICEMIAIMNI
jgi:hypothetical protein